MSGDRHGRGNESVFRGPILEDLPKLKWALLLTGTLGGGFGIWTVVSEPEPEPELVELPDRFARMMTEPTQEASRQEQEVLEASRLLLKIIGTTGESAGSVSENQWSDEAGLGDIDAALARVGGTSDIGALGGVGGGRGDLGGSASVASVTTASGSFSPAASLGPAVGETWVDPGTYGMTTTATDRYSTFSIDVDTASWTRTRKQLRSGHLPPNAMVRVEEFVNYLPYDYAPPRGDAPFAVHFEAAPSPWHTDRLVARIGLQGRKVAAHERKPAHITFLIDTSGSMQSRDKIGLVRQSMKLLVDELDGRDTVAIVTYAGQSTIPLRPTRATDREAIADAIDTLRAGGSTAMAQGLRTAYELADQARVPGHVNRIILASDGDANVGYTDPERLVRDLRSYAERGITLTTLGYGTGNYRDHRMEQLADDGDGNYSYIDSIDEARRILVDGLTGTLEVIARDVKIQVDFDPEVVRSYRLLGYENREIADRDFRNDAVDAGEVGAGHQVTALYELVVSEPRPKRFGRLQLRYKPPGADVAATEVWVPLAGGVRPAFSELSADTRIAVAAAGFAEVLRDSEHARDISLRQVAQVARSAQRVEYAQDRELLDLIERADRLGANGVVATSPVRDGHVPLDIAKAVRRYTGQLKYCYESRLKAVPGLEGRLEMAWTVANGSTSGVHVTANSTGDAELASCVERKIRRWKFLDSTGGEVRWPFEFRRA